jgi:hypothetical protein
MSKIYTIEEVRKLTSEWMAGADDKSKRAWRKLLKDIKNK